MDETAADIEREIELTRERMADTIGEIESRVSGTVSDAKEKVNVLRMAREHPWTALAVALGAGILLSATGADEKLLSAAADAASNAVKSAGPALAGLAGRAKDAVTSSREQSASEPPGPGLMDRVSSKASEVFGVDDLKSELRTASRGLGEV